MASADSALWGLTSEIEATQPVDPPIVYHDPESRWHYTATGAKVEPFLPEATDGQLFSPPCAWCQGYGESVADEDAPFFHQQPFPCPACGGTGKSGYQITRLEWRKQQWDSMIFMIDAPRAELMDRDCCPDCGCGGGHDFPWHCTKYDGPEPSEADRRMEAECYGEEYPPKPTQVIAFSAEVEAWKQNLDLTLGQLADEMEPPF